LVKHAVIRKPIGETWTVKQLLNIGAKRLLTPMVENPTMAEAM